MFKRPQGQDQGGSSLVSVCLWINACTWCRGDKVDFNWELGVSGLRKIHCLARGVRHDEDTLIGSLPRFHDLLKLTYRQYPRSPVAREPLLAGAQSPGMSQRFSDTSLLSSEHSMSNRPGASSASFSSTNRFGPTAQLSPSPSPDPDQSSRMLADSLSNGTDDDDDPDDHLHTFTAAEKRDLSSPFDITSWRGWANAITLVVFGLALVGLFALYPILSFYYGNNTSSGSNTSGYNLGGINGSGQYPAITGLPTLIDVDTPSSAYTRTGFDGKTWNLVFSDEFNKDGRSVSHILGDSKLIRRRTFYDGDDPFFEAVDLHYWPTG